MNGKRKGIPASKNHLDLTVFIAQLESTTRDEPVGSKKSARLDTQCSICVHQKRHRLADPDDISAKALIDGVRYTGLLRNDSAKEIKEVRYTQEKCSTNEQEKTEITIKWEEKYE